MKRNWSLFFLIIGSLFVILLAAAYAGTMNQVDEWKVEVIDIQRIGDRDYLFFKTYEDDQMYYISSDMNSLIFYDLEVGDLITVHKYVNKEGFRDAGRYYEVRP